MTDETIRCISNLGDAESILDRAILSIRSTRPHVGANLPYTVYSRGDYAQIWINAPACRFSLLGKCSICDYWDGEYSKDAVEAACNYIELHGNEYVTLLLNTCGSCFCEEELPFQALLQVAQSIAKTSVSRVVFESHLSYVRLDKLKVLVDVLCGKELVVEYGQESTSPEVLKYCLNKPSMLREYTIVDSIHELGIKIFANVILGVPFLSVSKRVEDAVNSIRSLLNSSVDGIVLFPVNIKPYTLVKFLYDKGYYKRVDAIEIIKVLGCFNENDLEKIELAWFEPQREVQAAYEEHGLSPAYSEPCGKRILNGLNNYCTQKDGVSRKYWIQQLQNIQCECIVSVNEDNCPDITKCYEFLEESFPQRGVYATN